MGSGKVEVRGLEPPSLGYGEKHAGSHLKRMLSLPPLQSFANLQEELQRLGHTSEKGALLSITQGES